jgi:hypothetical protein
MDLVFDNDKLARAVSGSASARELASSSPLDMVVALVPLDIELSELFFFDFRLKNPLIFPPPPPPVIEPESDLLPSLFRVTSGRSPPKESDRFLIPVSVLESVAAGSGGGVSISNTFRRFGCVCLV